MSFLPLHLFGGALNWYCSLPPETVNSFEELRKLFFSQHIFQIDRLHYVHDLYTICQNLDELLRKYAGRFSHEYSRCAEADDKTALKVFMVGLHDCFFKYMINANTWKTYSEVMTYAYNYASAKGKKKDFHHHQSHFSKKSKGHYRNNQGARKNNEQILRPGHQVFHVEDVRGGKFQKPNWDLICFYPDEERGIIYPYNGPLIVEAHIANFDVRLILVDIGASVNIMFAEAFRALNVAEHLLDPSITPLISFFGDIVQPLGNIHLPLIIGTSPYTTSITTNFLVVDCPTTYNVIFGYTGINDVKAMVSTHMLLMKFPTPSGNGYIRRDQLSARSCYNSFIKQQHLPMPNETLSIYG
ncbi:uncharacterized protein [Pyrus communis]|uniref:uncharacterized protein n=1 Tax=Pyrus communis TaxID=23211 RepID=UPI0035C0BEE4